MSANAAHPPEIDRAELIADRSLVGTVFCRAYARRVDEWLQALFEAYGEVASVEVIKDRLTGESKGFAFVAMDRQADAEHAIKELNGRAVDGRNLTVNIAKPKNARSSGKSRRR